MSNQGFGLAEMKCEGDTIFFDVFNEFDVVKCDAFAKGKFFVIGEDNQPMVITRQGVDYFLMHEDKHYAETKFKLSAYARFIKRLKGLFND